MRQMYAANVGGKCMRQMYAANVGGKCWGQMLVANGGRFPKYMRQMLAAKLCGIIKLLRHIIYDRNKAEVEISAPIKIRAPNLCVHQKIGAQTLCLFSIWAWQNLQLLTSSKLAAKLCGIIKLLRHIIYDRNKADVEISAPIKICAPNLCVCLLFGLGRISNF